MFAYLGALFSKHVAIKLDTTSLCVARSKLSGKHFPFVPKLFDIVIMAVYGLYPESDLGSNLKPDVDSDQMYDSGRNIIRSKGINNQHILYLKYYCTHLDANMLATIYRL